jgi:hypothetical protein
MFACLNVVVCFEHEMQVSVCCCGVSFHCVFIYRCTHLKELKVCYCDKVTDAGISMVISRCNQLHVLNLRGLPFIAGMCAHCLNPEPTLCSITLWCVIFLQQVHQWAQRPTTVPYCKSVQFNLCLHNLFSNPPLYSMLQSNTPHHHPHF